MQGTETQLRKRLKAFSRIRVQFRESVSDPLRAAIIHRVPMASAQIVWAIPLECAAAGFTLEILQDDQGWHVLLTRAIDSETALEAAGEAQSLLKALFQMVDAAERNLSDLEAGTRGEIKRNETAPTIAA